MNNKDHTPCGTKIEGAYENERNAAAAELFKAIIRKVFNVKDVIVGHHLVYVTVERCGSFDIQIVQEVPSADALIFDHHIARSLWGEDWQKNLATLAITPPEQRDAMLANLCEGKL